MLMHRAYGWRGHLLLEDEDLIEEEIFVITLSDKGYDKRLAQDEFRSQVVVAVSKVLWWHGIDFVH